MGFYLIPFRTASGDIAYEGAHEECMHLFYNEDRAELHSERPNTCIHCGGCGGIVVKPKKCFWHGKNCPIINNTFEPRIPF